MNLRSFLILMTLVAVLSDYLLHPFYPQFFELRFGVTDPKMVGYYFAAICFMVMIAFPFWAYLSQKIPTLKILVVTQTIAGMLALYCFETSSYLNFWIASLVMILFKGSYLLIYPFILKIVKKEEHTDTIGLLSVIVHLGGIIGAVIGGLAVDLLDPRYIFLIMALGDFVQMLMSVYLLNNKQFASADIANQETKRATAPTNNSFILKVGLLTLVLYFGDFLIRPFFSSYWELISVYDSKLVSGTMYAIPGFVALIGLFINKRRTVKNLYQGILSALFLGIIGLWLQASSVDGILVLGRVIYGWAIFQAMVRFDVLLFEKSHPDSYAMDYSKIHFFQNLGVLLASLFVGIIVDAEGLQMPFIIALGCFVLTLILYVVVFYAQIKIKEQLAKS
ncbi:MFS transporter [Aureispira anguillae]|uniref:MFS transporter n=1 Tax=Aureispira anguillae TaxID=2864201 RepID=A0A915YDQ2_9BACT|nr:MFS transporter [Aureispira anguillae]BDS11222.1 MFS transporter [Aureispira anguillae]